MTSTAEGTTPEGTRGAVPVLAPLRRRADFLRVAAARRRWAAPGLVLQVAPLPTDAPVAPGDIRVGYTASRKVGGAVVRNRARRRLREAVRRVVPAHARPDCDYVVIARAATPGRPFAALVDDLETALRRCRAWRDGVAEARGGDERAGDAR